MAKSKGPYKGVPDEVAPGMTKHGGPTTEAYKSLKGRDGGTSHVPDKAGAIAPGMSGAGGVTSEAIKSLTAHAKSCTPSKETAPEGTVAKP